MASDIAMLDEGHIASRDCWCNPYTVEMGIPLVITSSMVIQMWHPIFEIGKPLAALMHVGAREDLALTNPSISITGQVQGADAVEYQEGE